MKNRIFLVGLTILLVIVSSKSFSQDQKEKKNQIEPALLGQVVK
jgi:hypothetical protein